MTLSDAPGAPGGRKADPNKAPERDPLWDYTLPAEHRVAIARIRGTFHPWYGPCDGLGDKGECSECQRLATPNPPIRPNPKLRQMVEGDGVPFADALLIFTIGFIAACLVWAIVLHR